MGRSAYQNREFGLSAVGPGWAQLINPLYDLISEINANGPRDTMTQEIVNQLTDALIEVAQVKEKFGGLRFYYHVAGTPTPEQAKRLESFKQAVQAAESDSEKICETCGKPGETRLGGWLQTLCDEHAQAGGSNWWKALPTVQK